MTMRRLVGIAAVVILAVVVASASATLPGKNGRIVFKRYFEPDQWSALFTVGSDGRGEKQLTHTSRNVTDDQPDWSPDASLIVFTRCPAGGPCAIYTVKPDGSQLKRLSPKPCLPGPPGCEDGANVSFLPDGRHVVYTRSTGGVRHFATWEQIEHSDIVVRDLDGRDPRVLIRSKRYSNDFNSPQFSPDGSHVVYVRANSPLSKPALHRAVFVANADGSGSRRITPWSLNGGDNPDWAPNGKLIVFRSHEEDEGAAQSQIYVVKPDGSALRAITHFRSGTEVLSYSFSPDGKWITFAKTGASGLPDLFVMRPNGKNIRRITRSKLWDSAPDWGSAD
jgi:Tol biopolymer transport system component